MKPLSDRDLGMRRGEPESSAFFPEEPHYKELPPASEIRGFSYPDTEEDIHADQEEAIRDASRNQPREGFRH